MKIIYKILVFTFLISNTLFSQITKTNKISQKTKSKNSMNNNQNNSNPLLCDPAEGVCGVPDSSANTATHTDKPLKIKNEKPIKVIYFTDPICSSCWGIEPQLRKLKLEYGNSIEIEYKMGGLLPDWGYNKGGISKPSDVASHWDEVSPYYDMPIDGDVWLEDPLHSSYPPSIAYKAAELQDKHKALLFLREIRELVFLHKKNITKWEILELAAKKVGLDVIKLKSDYEGKAKILFEDDMKLSKSYGVKGFPTMFFIDNSGNKEVVFGSKPYAFYEIAVLKLNESANQNQYNKTWESLFAKYNTLTAKEYSELSGINRIESEKQLNDLVNNGKLEKFTTKNGSIWKLIN